jgi:hypothetical protein
VSKGREAEGTEDEERGEEGKVKGVGGGGEGEDRYSLTVEYFSLPFAPSLVPSISPTFTPTPPSPLPALCLTLFPLSPKRRVDVYTFKKYLNE